MPSYLSDAAETKVPRGARSLAVARRRGKAWRRGTVIGISSLLLNVTAQGASAQVAPGYSGYSDGGTVNMGDEEVWQALRVFGSCYARVSTAHALELLGTEPSTQAERDAVRRAIRDPQNCFGYVSRVRAPYAWLRGAVAEGLWKRRVAVPAALHRAAPARGSESSIYDSARCVAVANGDQVRALLAAPIGSRGEREGAAALLAGSFRRCVPADIGELSLSPLMVRYLLVEALLRLPSQSAGQR